MLRRTDLDERWRPPNILVGGHVRGRYVRPAFDVRRANDVRHGLRDRRRQDDEQPRSAEVTLWGNKIRAGSGPDSSLCVVHR